MTALISDQPHTGDICLTVTDKDDVTKWHRAIFVGDEVVDEPVIVNAKRTLVDTEKILRLCGVINRKRRPFRGAICVISERRGEHLCELLSDFRRLDHLPDARRDDVVLQFHVSLPGTFIDAVEPVGGALKQGHSFSMSRKVLSAYGNVLRRSTLQHKGHVGEHFVGLVLLGSLFVLLPEGGLLHTDLWN